MQCGKFHSCSVGGSQHTTPYLMMGQAHTDDGDHPTIPEMSGKVFCIMWNAQFGS